MIKLHEIHKVYFQGTHGHHALNNITLYFEKGEIVTVVGPSGCGKTTLLNLLGGLDRPTSGDMVINDKLTTDFREKQWDYFRNHNIGFIFQQYNLIEHLPIVENVAMSLKLSGEKNELSRKKAEELLIKVGLENHLEKKPGQLSGGERQRVAIARALINDPDIILADEPTGALDKNTSKEIMDLIKSISEDKLVIIVTHDKKIADKYGTRRIELKDGKVVSDTKPVEKKVKVRPTEHIKTKKLGFFESIRLSLYNLKGKMWRTLLVAFGLSIGIVGLILIDSFFNSIRDGLEAQNAVIINNPDLYIYGTVDDHTDIDTMKREMENFGYFKEILYAPNSTYIITKNVSDDTLLATPVRGSGIENPTAQSITQTFTKLVGDSRFPTNDNEMMISISTASNLVSSNLNLTTEEIWTELKGNSYLIYDQYEYLPYEYDIFEGLMEGTCLTTSLWDGTNGVAPSGYDETVLGDFSTNLAALQSYRPSRLIKSDTEEIFCADYDAFNWYMDMSSPTGEGYEVTLVGIYDNNLFRELILSDNVINSNPNASYNIINNDTEVMYQADQLRLRTFLNEDELENKFSVVLDIESRGYFVQENIDNGFGALAGITDFFMYLLQFVFSSITLIAVISGALMLLLILYVSIIERKREIGLIRAMGGTKGDIRTIYTGETTFIGLISGLMSVILAIILVIILNIVVYNNYMDLVIEYLPFVDPKRVLTINYGMTIIAILSAIGVAVLSGLAPAISASRKNPIEALRNE